MALLRLSSQLRFTSFLAAFLPLATGLALLSFAVIFQPVYAEPLQQGGTGGEQIFQARCASCHTIGGGKLVGPDLKGVTTRRDPAWIKRFISNPPAMLASDPTAKQLLSENNNIQMPNLGLSAADIDALVLYLGSASGAPVVSGAGAGAPAAAGDPAAGQRYFTGQLALTNGGPPCIGCHTVSGVSSLGGGALGPDLTHVAQRYAGPGLAAALGNIAFPTMMGPFGNRALTPVEQADLVAFFTQADQQQPPVPIFAPGTITPNTWQVLGYALAGAVVLFLVMLFFWPRQRQSLSARLRGSAGLGKR